VSERLTLNLLSSATSPEEIERQVRRLGYGVARRTDDGGLTSGARGVREQAGTGEADILPTAHGPERGSHPEHGHATGC